MRDIIIAIDDGCLPDDFLFAGLGFGGIGIGFQRRPHPARWRRIGIPAVSAGILAAGIVLLALAAGGRAGLASAQTGNNRRHGGPIANRAGRDFEILISSRQGLARPIGDAPYQLIAFAAENRPLDPGRAV